MAATPGSHNIDVILDSRGPNSPASLVDELGPHATMGTIEDAGRGGTAVLLSVPMPAY